ncbi:IucC family-domain-containing protein [Hysterangium stoloniferum]|nr:IucC family-domain-containing protein [Hysterangium stoloniferum]
MSQSAASLIPADRASFATSSRLLSCLVTESLLKAFFVPATSSQLAGTAIILTSTAGKRSSPYAAEDVLAIIPLRDVPIIRPDSTTEIGLLDPLDMLPKVYELAAASNNTHDALEQHIFDALRVISPISTRLINSAGPLHLWKKFADDYGINEDLQESVAEELRSSVAWQQYSYENPPLHAPTFDSSSIEWEQCIIEGHPTHPMHKARRAIEPIPTINPGDYDWQRPLIHIVAVPRNRVSLLGSWEDLVQPVRAAAAEKAGKPIEVPHDHVLVPIHELQIVNVRKKFPEAQILPDEYHVEALAQQSLRSVIVPSVLRPTQLKLAFGIRLTSAVRTISPSSAYLGPRFSSQIVPRLVYDRSLLIVQRELATVSSTNPDPEVAKHLGCIVREAYENICEEEHGERAIVCTALVELGYGGNDEVPLVQTAFGLDTEEKRIAWFDKFADLFFKAFLPSVLANGVAFEGHPQNTLARFDMQTRELKGFVIRDFGGLKIHPPSVIASTDLQTLDDIIAPGHSIIVDMLEDVHTRLYHTLIHNHLQQLIRVLGLHYSGAGWRIVRRRLNEQIPHDHELRKLWLSPETQTLPGKCFMRMRLQGMYRTASDEIVILCQYNEPFKQHLHGPFPNLIHYQGTNFEVDKK